MLCSGSELPSDPDTEDVVLTVLEEGELVDVESIEDAPSAVASVASAVVVEVAALVVLGFGMEMSPEKP